MEKLKMHSLNKVESNIEKIAALFPNCITERINAEGKLEHAIDFDILKQELSTEIVEGLEERYQFTWPDKKKAILAANAPINKTLRPCREESVDFDNTENLYIEGDNLEVLKLLQETYLHKIKMIYIDPPYNTGNDFVYHDDFSQNVDEYLDNSGQFDENENRMVKNLETNGRFHTDWLNMMYPRLKLAKDLLTDDGVIFISINDNEQENLKKICDEVFGDKNFVDCLHWKKKKQPSFLAKHTAKMMEYILVYAKDKNILEKLSIEHLSDDTKKVINISNPEVSRTFKPGVIVKVGETGTILKGKYRIRTMDIEYLNDVHYTNGITTNTVDVVARFSVSQDKINNFIDNNLLFITANYGLRRNVSVEEKSNRKSITDLLLSEWGDNQESDKEFLSLFDKKYFDYTKPVALIYNFIKSIFSEDQIILDFFSGSATTAHAVMQLNAEDGGKRKFIVVQLPEVTDENSEAYKDGFKNICEIGKERIRRAGQKIKEENPLTTQDLDTGFRVLKIDSSNMKDVYYTPKEYTNEITDIFDLVDNVKEDRTDEDLLFQVMLDLGTELSSKIVKKEIAGKAVYDVAEGHIIACFADGLTNEIVTEIAKQKPSYFITRDSALENDSVAANYEQIFNKYSPATEKRVL